MGAGCDRIDLDAVSGAFGGEACGSDVRASSAETVPMLMQTFTSRRTSRSMSRTTIEPLVITTSGSGDATIASSVRRVMR